MAGDDEGLPSLDDWAPPDEDFWGAGAFLVPPPPPPPSLGAVCSSELYCELEGGPMGAHFDRAAYPQLPVVAVVSSVIVVAILVASFLFWRHKSKVQNLLPCKNEQQAHMGELGAANGVTYEDVLINHHPTRLPQSHLPGTQTLMPLEIIDVKLGDIGPPPITTLHHSTFFPNRDPGQIIGVVRPFHPVYEEVSQAPSVERSTNGKSFESDLEESGKIGGRSLTSEDDFAEDELSAPEGSGPCSATSSVRGSTGGDLCRDPVSSDEGNAEDCDFSISNLPDMLPSDVAFKYPRKHSHGRHGHPEKMRGNPRPHPHSHQHNIPTYPLPDRTVSVIPPAQRVMDPLKGSRSHSNSLTDCRNQPLATHFAPVLSPSKSNLMPVSVPWQSSHGLDNGMSYPTGSPSQENIYSTIDEDELPDYTVHPPFTSLNCPQRGSPTGKNDSLVPKGVPGRADRPVLPPLLSQRNADDKKSSYGDIMPAFTFS